jgi:hypothetical protein
LKAALQAVKRRRLSYTRKLELPRRRCARPPEEKNHTQAFYKAFGFPEIFFGQLFPIPAFPRSFLGGLRPYGVGGLFMHSLVTRIV